MLCHRRLDFKFKKTMESVNRTGMIMTMNIITVIRLPTNSKTYQYVKISIRLMEPMLAIKVSPKKSIELTMLISHLPIMQTSTPDRDSHLIQSLILMTIQVQMMTID